MANLNLLILKYFLLLPAFVKLSTSFHVKFAHSRKSLEIDTQQTCLQSCANSALSFVGSKENANSTKADKLSKLKQRLSVAGQAGIVAYGATNCIYYTLATFIVWKSTNRREIVGKPNLGKLGVGLQRLAKLSIAVWAMSQMTKALRVVIALACAPLFDRIISRIDSGLKLSNRNKAAGILVAGMLTIVLTFYSIMIVLLAR